ncbi:DUF6565 domain-containing protein [Aureispira anguillae]|uniref:DUF6565 domain-containing protein n=1 Tax=Aureispira anguillae TaxID=2864201 RepID=A0A915YJ57_9BACT|nr:DUF6565 domain-containing protein [Aureispira anguillae]BDS13803.1 hypothetical protein AsAng_0045650 [Aureispira anguillae]
MRSITSICTYLFVSCYLLMVASCSNFISCGGDKDTFINNFYAFVEEIRAEQKNGTIPADQWEKYDEQFNKLTNECYPQFEADLNTNDQLGVATCVGFYFYAKYGLTAVLKLAQTDAAIKKILLEIDYTVLLNMAKEIVNNPEEIHKIMGDLEKRYGN